MTILCNWCWNILDYWKSRVLKSCLRWFWYKSFLSAIGWCCLLHTRGLRPLGLMQLLNESDLKEDQGTHACVKICRYFCELLALDLASRPFASWPTLSREPRNLPLTFKQRIFTCSSIGATVGRKMLDFWVSFKVLPALCARYCMTIFALSVFPAPDSPLTKIACCWSSTIIAEKAYPKLYHQNRPYYHDTHIIMIDVYVCQ